MENNYRKILEENMKQYLLQNEIKELQRKAIMTLIRYLQQEIIVDLGKYIFMI